MPEIILNTKRIHYIIKYSNRCKNIRLRLTSPENIQVTVPIGYHKSNIKIDQILKNKANWIMKQSSRLSRLQQNPVNKFLTQGSYLLYLGEQYSIMYAHSTQPMINLNQKTIVICLPPHSADLESAAAMLRSWYIRMAADLLMQKTVLWASRIGVKPSQVKIKDPKTRWGSCSSRRIINYNWRIIMAPENVIDYLVVHELCHLLVPNHSEAFWERVANYNPRFKDHRRWLTDNGFLLMRIL